LKTGKSNDIMAKGKEGRNRSKTAQVDGRRKETREERKLRLERQQEAREVRIQLYIVYLAVLGKALFCIVQ
jgi:hypothetical protein